MIDRERDFDFDEPMHRGSMGRSGETTSSTSGESSDNLVDLAQQKAGPMGDQAKQAAGDLMEQARLQASQRVSDQKERVVETLGGFSQAVRETGTQLRTQDQAMIAEFADRAAEQIDRFSGYLTESNMDDMVHEVEHFARRQPLLFVGGTFLLGFLGARFLMSSAPKTDFGTGYGQVPRNRVPARTGFPDTPGRTYGAGSFGSTGSYSQSSYPSHGTSPTTGTTTGTGGLSHTSSGSNLSTPPSKPEDADAAA